MLQIYRIILEYPSNIYIFLDIFQLSTLFLFCHTKIGINHVIDFLALQATNCRAVAWLVEEP